MSLSYSEIQKLKAIAQNFQIAEGEITHVIQVNSGRINSSYKITVTQEDDTVSYMLQKINRHVFSNVDNVINNALLITKHLRSKGMETLEYVYTKKKQPYFRGADGDYRMTKFIHAEIFQNVTRPKDMFNLGYAVGQFAVGLSDFKASKLVDTIPNFHNTRVRYENLLASAIANANQAFFSGHEVRSKINVGRSHSATKELLFAYKHREEYGAIVDAINCKAIPLRVTHNDTKLNNVLFDRKTNVPRCLIDLDTVMSGSVLYDIADAIRSGANTKSEDSKSIANIMIDLELAEEFLKGFAQGAPGMLTKKEIELLPLAIKIIPIELGMRYLTDYFDGDVYFGIVNEDDNYNRAKVQFALAEDISEHMDEITKIVKEVFA